MACRGFVVLGLAALCGAGLMAGSLAVAHNLANSADRIGNVVTFGLQPKVIDIHVDVNRTAKADRLPIHQWVQPAQQWQPYPPELEWGGIRLASREPSDQP